MLVLHKRNTQRDSMAETFGQWLKKTRISRSLNQEQLARLANISKQYVSALEREAPHGITGASPTPKLKTVKALATALAVPESEALRRAGYYPQEAETDPRQAQLLSYFRELSDNEKDDALALIETVYRRRERIRRIPVSKGAQGLHAAAKSAKARKRK